jgi:hypothetical protein
MQPGTNLVWRERLSATLGTNDHHTGCGDTCQTCQAEKFPGLHEQGSQLSRAPF